MKVVELYILRRTATLFAATLVWVLAIVWTTQVLNRINLVTDSGQSAATFFVVGALVLPSVIPIVLPFAIGIAVAQTLTTMNTDSELVVISASGASRATVIRPIVLLALGASIASFAINNTLEPYARQKFRDILASAHADLLSTVVQEGTFKEVENNLFVQIGERLPNGQLGDIFVADSREKGLDLVYHARRGATVATDTGNFLVMQDGSVHRKTADGDVSVIRFDSYAFDLSEFAGAASGPTLFPKDRYLPELLDPDPNDHLFQTRPQMFRGELHMRFSEWLYPLAFALIGLAVAGDARSFREARLHPMVTIMGIAILVRWAGFYAGNQAEAQAAYVPVLYAIPLVTSAVAIGFIASNKVMEPPVRWTERMMALFQRASDLATKLRLRMAGFRRPSGGRA